MRRLAGAWQLYSESKPDEHTMPEDRPMPLEPSPELIELRADGTFRQLIWRAGQDERDAELSLEGSWQAEGARLVLRPQRAASHSREQFERGLRDELSRKGKKVDEGGLKGLFDALYGDITLTPTPGLERLRLEPSGDAGPNVISKNHNWFYVRAL